MFAVILKSEVAISRGGVGRPARARCRNFQVSLIWASACQGRFCLASSCPQLPACANANASASARRLLLSLFGTWPSVLGLLFSLAPPFLPAFCAPIYCAQFFFFHADFPKCTAKLDRTNKPLYDTEASSSG